MKKAFSMVELIFVIIIIGILSAVAIPRFSSIKDRAKISTELSTANTIQSSLDSIHGDWQLNDEDFDYNNDGVVDDISSKLSPSGYPLNPSKNQDPFGDILRSKSGFKLQRGFITKPDFIYAIYTGIASNPTSGVNFSKNSPYDIKDKPDKNDFWIYIPELNATSTCNITSNYSTKKEFKAGDFLLIDVKQKVMLDFTKDDLGINLNLSCN